MKTLFLKYHIELLAALAVLLFVTTREPSSPYDKMIGSDGKGYYAYLPAIFIHGDLSYDFVETYERTHYGASDDFFDFRIQTESGTVNKYFPGVAILWLPFFLLAHVFALLFGFAADGYSLPYQIAIGLAAIFYLWLGLKFLKRILERYKIEGWINAFVIWIIFFGTNLYYYTIEEPSFTHVYSFALINIFGLTVIRLSKKYQPIGLYILTIILGLIIITRPVNGIIIFAIPLLAGTTKQLINLFRNIFGDSRNLIGATISGLAVLLIVPLLWYLQSGKPILYTYGDESFHILYSYIFDVLFSYRNGWLVYTPLALVSIFGLYPIFKKTFLGGLKIAVFLFIIVYTIGCWSVWWYGEAFGMRPMIEFYFVIAILLGFWLNFVQKKKTLVVFSLIILIALTAFNLFQSWQFRRGILPAKHLSEQTYWANFLSTSLKAKVYINDQKWKLIQTFYTDLESDPGWLNFASKSKELSFSGKLASKIDSSNVYSIGFRENISSFLDENKFKVVVSAMTYANQENTHAQLIIDFLDLKGNSKAYNTFFLKEFLPGNKWISVEFAADIPTELLRKCSLAVYFWNPAANEEIFIDDIKIEVWEATDY